MNCPTCQQSNEDGARYCQQCGAPLPAAPAQPSMLQMALGNTWVPHVYSGRGMFGETCLAVTVDSIGDVMAALIENTDDDTRFEFAKAARSLRTDDSGGRIVVYFPGIKFVETASCRG